MTLVGLINNEPNNRFRKTVLEIYKSREDGSPPIYVRNEPFFTKRGAKKYAKKRDIYLPYDKNT